MSLLAALPAEFDPRPLPPDGLGPAEDEDGVLLLDLAGGDAPAAADAAARCSRLPLIAIVAPGTTEPPPFDCHTFLTAPVAPFVLARALAQAADHARLRREQVAARQELEELHAIGVRLTAERDTDALLDLILTKARAITRSDAGSIYVVEEPRGGPRHLRFTLAQNDSVQVPFTEFTLPINQESIAGHVALTGEIVQVDDAYDAPEGFPCRINREFDLQIGYRTKSMLVVPMRTPSGEVIGVLQLINGKRDAAIRFASGEAVEHGAIPYSPSARSLAASLASQAAVALENSRLYASIERLFEGFVQASVIAIESRDPTTSGHSFRVANLTVALAGAVDRADNGPLAAVRFSADQMREIRYASLLHDFGKVGVREEILVKAKKLHPWHLELIQQRGEIIKRGVQLRHARRKLDYLREHGAAGFSEAATAWDAELACALDEIASRLELVAQANEPLVLPGDRADRVPHLALPTFIDHLGEAQTLVTPEEAQILSIPRGSLTAEEFRQIQSHVTHTFQFLSQIPWTRALSRIPEIARSHHEKLDGSGYPLGKRAADIPVQSRMMTIADIFDALTASDRPYKAAIPVERALDILSREARLGSLDPSLLEIFIDIRPWTPHQT